MPSLVLNDDVVQQLQGIANSRSLPDLIVQSTRSSWPAGGDERNTQRPQSVLN
jgi:hypothetical protein